jgi:hypothetical protein
LAAAAAAAMVGSLVVVVVVVSSPTHTQLPVVLTPPPLKSFKVSSSRRTSDEELSRKYYIDKLYWISGSRPPSSESKAYYFSVDNELTYEPFHKDFGPLNLAKTHKYVRELVRLLSVGIINTDRYSESL